MILNKKGFTLIELIIVITIVFILATILVQSFGLLTNKKITNCLKESFVELRDGREYYQRFLQTADASPLGDRLEQCLSNKITLDTKREREYIVLKDRRPITGTDLSPASINHILDLAYDELSDPDFTFDSNKNVFQVLQFFYPQIDSQSYNEGVFKDKEVVIVKTPQQILQEEKEVKDFYNLLIKIFIGGLILVFTPILIDLFLRKAKNKQLSWYKLYTILITYGFFRKRIIGTDEKGVDLEMYLHFQKLLLSQDFTYTKSSLSYMGDTLSIDVGSKSIIKLSGKFNKELDKIYDDILQVYDLLDLELSVIGLSKKEIPLYLYRMVYEKYLSYIKYVEQLKEIEQELEQSEKEKKELIEELNKKRTLLDQIKGTQQSQEVMPLVSSVLELEQITKEHQALMKRAEEIKKRKF